MRFRFYRWLAFRLPTYLVYWCAMRVMAKATSGPYSDQEVPALTFIEGMSRWENT